MPLGLFYRKKVDGKYANRVDVHKELLDSIVFCDCLKRECEQNLTLNEGGQIHFRADASDGDSTTLEVEQGNYIPFSVLLRDTPAAVAKPGFVSGIIGDLLQTTAFLHTKGVYHVCFSPDNVFVRTGDKRPMLLSHGSFYHNAAEPKMLYDGFDGYVSPEVMAGNKADERSDVYSIGKFLEYLFAVAEMPYEYKAVVKKATEILPDNRYQTVEDMADAVKRRVAARRTFVTTAAAVVIALLIVGAYFGLVPDEKPVEFVAPVAKQAPEDLLDKGFDPTTELGTAPSDTASMMSEEERQRMKEYEDKCEQIFRKMYTKEADRILSKIYNSTYMGSNEKKFMAGSRNTMSELVKVQAELAEQAHLSDARSRRIASEIIEQLTEEKKKALAGYGIQK